MLHYKTRPFFLLGPFRSLVTTYGVNSGEVYVNKSLLGIKVGDRPSIPIKSVSRVHAQGTIFGDIIFGEGSHSPVIWKGVLFPEAKLKEVKQLLKLNSPAGAGLIASNDLGIADLPVRHLNPAVGSEAESLKALLRTISAEQRIAPAEPTKYSISRTLRISRVAQANASQAAPLSMPSQPGPKLVRWSPDGQAIVTVCGAWGCTFWGVYGNALNNRWSFHPPSCYGDPVDIIWNPEGTKFLLTGNTGMGNYVGVYNAIGHSLECPPAQAGAFRWGDKGLASLTYKMIDVPPLQPWRPKAPSFLVPSGASINLIDEQLVPGRDRSYSLSKQTNSPHLSNFLKNLAISLGLTQSPDMSKREDAIDPAIIDSMDFHSLGVRAASVQGISWHPSGQFLALSTGDESGLWKCTHIIHYQTGSILATIPGGVVCGWSQGGRWLLLEVEGRERTRLGIDDRVIIWDALTDSSRGVTGDDIASRDFARMIASVSCGGKANSTGDFFVSTSDGIHSILKLSDKSIIGTLPKGTVDVSWSPTDSNLFASVGGVDSENDVQLWTISEVR